MKVEYWPKFKFPVILHSPGGCSQSMSVNKARRLYEELGEILKKIPPEKHEPVRFGPAEK